METIRLPHPDAFRMNNGRRKRFVSSFQWERKKKEGECSLLIVGDTNVQNRSDPSEAFRDVRGVLDESDGVIGQLECPFAADPEDRKAGSVPYKTNWVHSSPDMVQAFVSGGFRAVGCAGNVLYGPDLVMETVSVLDAAGLAHSGAGADREAARAPAVFTCSGLRVGLLSRTAVFWPVGHAADTNTPGVATIKAHTAYEPGPRALEMPATPPIVRSWPDLGELEELTEDIRALRRDADLVILSCHWGVSGIEEVAEYQRIVARAAVSAGADLVFGHHPHVIQPCELVDGVPVFYSLGNFAFDWEVMRSKRFDGLLVRCIAAADGLRSVSVVPVRRDARNQIRIEDLSTEHGATIGKRFLDLCCGMGFVPERRGGEIVLFDRAQGAGAGSGAGGKR